MKAARVLWLVLAAGQAVAWGQTTAASFFNPLSPEGWIHLTGVSVYSGYYSSGGAGGFGGFEMPVQNPFLAGPSATAGVAATFGGSKSLKRTGFTWTYSLSYFNAFYGNHQFSSNGYWNQNQSLGTSWTRKLGSEWSLSTSLNGTLADLQQLYFNPSVLGGVAEMPMTFDDLAGAILAGKYTDSQLAMLLSGAPLQASPQQAYLYGRRLLTAAANVALSWAASGRTSVSFAVAGSRVQSVNGAGTSGGPTTAPAGSFLPQVTSATFSLSWSYSLSPRTQIGASLSSGRTFSALERGFATSGNISIGRKMSSRWFLQAQAGVGKLNYSQQTYATPVAPQYLYSGGIGFKTQTQTFLVSYNRSLGDAYGLGSGATSAATGAWTWRRPGSTWSVSAGGGYQQLANLTFSNTRSWLANAGVAKALSPHFSMNARYMYFQFPQNIRAVGLESSENGVSIGMTWSPSPSPSQYR